MILTELNIELYAAKGYENPNCVSIEEFVEDFNRLRYIKRLIRRYSHGDLQERLILNHLIVIFNVFGVEASIKILKYKLNDNHWKVIKPFLIFLNHIEPTDFIHIIILYILQISK